VRVSEIPLIYSKMERFEFFGFSTFLSIDYQTIPPPNNRGG
jgi:hypothetical protein